MKRLIPWLLLLLPVCATTVAAQTGEGTDEKAALDRDQEALAQKTARLRELMERLRERYEKEGKTQLVDLLRSGIEHLEKARVIDEMTAVSRELRGKIHFEAMRRQEKVVQDLEGLLAILLDKRSMENLEEEARRAEAQARRVGELLETQRKLTQETQDIKERGGTEAERRIANELQELAKRERQEAQANAQRAGERFAVMEEARRRIENLLKSTRALPQEADEARRAQEQAQEQAQAFDPAGQADQLFREQKEILRRAAAQEARAELPEAAQELARQLGTLPRNAATPASPEARAQQAAEMRRRADQMERAAQTSAANNRTAEQEAQAQAAQQAARAARDMAKALEQGRTVPQATAEELGKELQALAESTKAQDAQSNTQLAEAEQSLAQRARELGQRVAQQAKDPAAAATNRERSTQEQAAQALAKAAEQLDKASAAAREQRRSAFQEDANRAENELAQARELLSQQDRPARRAGQMSVEANRVAQELRNLGSSEPAGQATAEEMDKAEQALRGAAEALQQEFTRPDQRRPRAGGEAAQQPPQQGGQASSRPGQPGQPDSRGEQAAAAPTSDQPRTTAELKQERDQQLGQAQQAMEQALKTLEQELQGMRQQAAAGSQQAAESQRQLRQQAQAARQAMEQAQQQGDLTPKQTEAAKQALEQADKQMQSAEKQLAENSPAAAASAQDQAAKALDQAREALEQNRPLSEEQQKQLEQVSKQEKELADEILRLAQEVERQKNARARRNLEEAGSQAQRASREIDRGDMEQAEDAEQQTERKLEEAQRDLQQERDRYMNLRHEELLFKIVEELKDFLGKQQDITRKTRELDVERGESQSLPRALRGRLRKLATDERDLGEKSAFLRESLENEGSQVYSFVLRTNEEDLKEVQQLMNGAEAVTGAYVQGLQEDVEKRTVDLLDALKEEARRREEERNQPQDQQQENTNQANQKPKLVPDVAELKMLKRLEEDVLARTQQFQKLFPELETEQMNDWQRSTLIRMAHRHNEITRIFKRFKQSLGIEGEEGEGAPETRREEPLPEEGKKK